MMFIRVWTLSFQNHYKKEQERIPVGWDHPLQWLSVLRACPCPLPVYPSVMHISPPTLHVQPSAMHVPTPWCTPWHAYPPLHHKSPATNIPPVKHDHYTGRIKGAVRDACPMVGPSSLVFISFFGKIVCWCLPQELASTPGGNSGSPLQHLACTPWHTHPPCHTYSPYHAHSLTCTSVPPVDRMMETHEWKHYLLATLFLPAVKKVSITPSPSTNGSHGNKHIVYLKAPFLQL